jgi:pyrimidine-nucleoside phosphorylase
MHTKLGESVVEGQPLITLFTEDPSLLNEPEEMLRETLQISQAKPQLQPLIREIVTKNHQRP